MNAKKYNNVKLAIGIAKGILTFILVLFFLTSGYSSKLVEALQYYSGNNYVLLILFTITTGIVSSVIFFPASYYTEFYLEHKYELSNQSFFQWIWEGLKGTFVGSIIGFPLLLLFYFILSKYGNMWWLPLSIVMFIVSVGLAKIIPIVIMPLFYKVTPIEDEDLKARIMKLASAVNMKVANVFQFDMSKNTKKANAAFTGLGKTKRVILGDTLLDKFSNDEIETVLAHEFGHYKHKHILKNIVIGTVSSFLTFYLLSVFYSWSLPWFGFEKITDIAALPILMLWGMLIGLVQAPVTNIISRRFEYQADEYAVLTTGKKKEFLSTLEKLTEQNLGDKEPHPFVEWFFYSHPSIKKRKNHILSIK